MKFLKILTNRRIEWRNVTLAVCFYNGHSPVLCTITLPKILGNVGKLKVSVKNIVCGVMDRVFNRYHSLKQKEASGGNIWCLLCDNLRSGDITPTMYPDMYSSLRNIPSTTQWFLYELHLAEKNDEHFQTLSGEIKLYKKCNDFVYLLLKTGLNWLKAEKS